MDSERPFQRLVMVGACYIDTILDVPHFPQEDHKLRAQSLERRRGGNVANALEVLQQFSDLDVELVLLCVLPEESSQGARLVKDSLSPRVTKSYCIHRPGHWEPAASYIIQAADRNSRTIVNYNELPEMTFADFREQVEKMGSIQKRTLFHFEGREVETSLECLRWLRRECPDVALSVEIEKPNRPGLEMMAAEADIVFYSKIWAEAKGFTDVNSFLIEQSRSLEHAGLLSCTWGADGAAVLTSAGGAVQVHRPAAQPRANVVDTIGAGDTFTAGVLYKLLLPSQGRSISDRAKEAVEFANQIAGRKVLQAGFSNLV